jgi:hypothetical protein
VVLPELEELKKITKERVFETSNEGELTMENINEVSFNKDDK